MRAKNDTVLWTSLYSQCTVVDKYRQNNVVYARKRTHSEVCRVGLETASIKCIQQRRSDRPFHRGTCLMLTLTVTITLTY